MLIIPPLFPPLLAVLGGVRPSVKPCISMTLFSVPDIFLFFALVCCPSSTAKRMKEDVALLLSGRSIQDRTPPKLPGHMDSAVSTIITMPLAEICHPLFFQKDGSLDKTLLSS